jgi:integrase
MSTDTFDIGLEQVFQFTVPRFQFGRSEMSLEGTKYIVRRGNRFQLRLPIPVDIQPKLYRDELRWSLRTGDEQIAKKKAFRATLLFWELCEGIRMIPNVSKAKSNEIVASFYDLLAQAHTPPSPLKPESFEYQANAQAWAAEDYAVEFARKVREKSLDGYDQRLMHEALCKLGINLTSYPYNVQRIILKSVSDAYFEHANYVGQVGATPDGSHTDTEGNEIDISSVQLIALAQTISQPPGPTHLHTQVSEEGYSLGERIADYIEKGRLHGHTSKGRWGDTSLAVNQKILGWFTELVGPQTDVRTITKKHGREFRDTLLKVKLGTHTKTPFAKATTGKSGEAISAATAANQLGYLKTFFSWLDAEGYIEQTPFRTLKVPVPQKQKSEEIRPFTNAEIDKLFSSPLYTGFKSPCRRDKPGNLGPVRDGFFWLPLVLLATGMRIGEASEIPIKNVFIDGSTPHFMIEEAKTYAGARVVPIHDFLLELGFDDWVGKLDKKYGSSKPLMLDFRTTGRLKNFASKKLGTYIDRTVSTDPTLVAHSFRHHFKDRARDALMPEYIQDQIIGHEGKKYVGDAYGKGASLEVLSEAMNKIDFGISDKIFEHLVSLQ